MPVQLQLPRLSRWFMSVSRTFHLAKRHLWVPKVPNSSGSPVSMSRKLRQERPRVSLWESFRSEWQSVWVSCQQHSETQRVSVQRELYQSRRSMHLSWDFHVLRRQVQLSRSQVCPWRWVCWVWSLVFKMRRSWIFMCDLFSRVLLGCDWRVIDRGWCDNWIRDDDKEEKKQKREHFTGIIINDK